MFFGLVIIKGVQAATYLTTLCDVWVWLAWSVLMCKTHSCPCGYIIIEGGRGALIASHPDTLVYGAPWTSGWVTVEVRERTATPNRPVCSPINWAVGLLLIDFFLRRFDLLFCRIERNSFGKMFSCGNTDMRRLTMGIRSEECVVRRFRRCANVYLHEPS